MSNNLPEGWKETTLDEIAFINPPENLKNGIKAKKVTMDMLIPFTKIIPTYSIEEYEGGMKFRNGDTLIARITPCLENGKNAYVDILDDGEIGFGSTEFIVLREKADSSDKQFLYYFALSPDFRDVAILSMTGSSGRQRVQTDVIRNHPFLFPPLPEQRAIAGVLSSLDDKIDLLHRQNKTLEQMAEALFRQWFVEEADDNWEEVPLDQVADYLNGLACQKYPPKNEVEKLPVLKIKELKNGFTDDSDWATADISEEYIVQNGDVIFSWSGSLLVKIWDGPKCVLNQHLFKITSKYYPKWFYYLWTKYYIDKFTSIAEGKATTMGHIKREDLSSSIVLIPSANKFKYMDKIISPIIEKIILNASQIRTLEKLRDTLLPKLISGEIRIKASEKIRLFKEAVLFSGVVSVMSDDKFSSNRMRVTKGEYLVKRYMGIDVLGEYSKMAAGPYNPSIRYKGPENIAVKNKYIEVVDKTHFKRGKKYKDAEKYIKEYEFDDALEWLKQFKYHRNSELELLTTVDYAALDLIKNEKDLSISNIIGYIKNDKVWKQKLEKKSDLFTYEKIKLSLQTLAKIFPETYKGKIQEV